MLGPGAGLKTTRGSLKGLANKQGGITCRAWASSLMRAASELSWAALEIMAQPASFVETCAASTCRP